MSCCFVLFFRQILLIGGSNPIEDVEKFKDRGCVTVCEQKRIYMKHSSPIFKRSTSACHIFYRFRLYSCCVAAVICHHGHQIQTREKEVGQRRVFHLCVSEQTLWSQRRAAWRTCSGGSQTVWTWLLQSGVLKFLFLMRQIDSSTWVLRRGEKNSSSLRSILTVIYFRSSCQ